MNNLIDEKCILTVACLALQIRPSSPTFAREIVVQKEDAVGPVNPLLIRFVVYGNGSCGHWFMSSETVNIGYRIRKSSLIRRIIKATATAVSNHKNGRCLKCNATSNLLGIRSSAKTFADFYGFRELLPVEGEALFAFKTEQMRLADIKRIEDAEQLIIWRYLNNPRLGVAFLIELLGTHFSDGLVGKDIETLADDYWSYRKLTTVPLGIKGGTKTQSSASIRQVTALGLWLLMRWTYSSSDTTPTTERNGATPCEGGMKTPKLPSDSEITSALIISLSSGWADRFAAENAFNFLLSHENYFDINGFISMKSKSASDAFNYLETLRALNLE